MDTAYAHSYGDLEEEHWWFRARRRILEDTIARLDWPLRPRIMEIGVGSGLNLYTLYPAGAEMLGIEPNADNAARARARGPVAVHVATVESLPSEITDASLDGITMFDVLEHTKDDLVSLRAVRQKLKPRGLLVLTVPAYMWLWGQQDDISHHYRRYTRSELCARLREAGFVIRRSTYFNTFLFPPIAAFRVMARGMRRADARMDTDFKYSVGFANHVLYLAFAAETCALRVMNFPFGVSVLAVAEKS